MVGVAGSERGIIAFLSPAFGGLSGGLQARTEKKVSLSSYLKVALTLYADRKVSFKHQKGGYKRVTAVSIIFFIKFGRRLLTTVGIPIKIPARKSRIS
jgi:hypothetical protein